MIKKLLIACLPLLAACSKKADPQPIMVDVIYEVESHTTIPIHAKYGVFFHNSQQTSTTLTEWEIQGVGTFTKTVPFEKHTVAAAISGLSPSSADWVVRIKSKNGTVLMQAKPVFYQNGGYQYYSANAEAYAE